MCRMLFRLMVLSFFSYILYHRMYSCCYSKILVNDTL